MQHIKAILENVFYSQANRTITLSLEKSLGSIDDNADIYDTMEQMKNVLNSVGVDSISFSPDSATMTIVTTEDNVDKILKVAEDFKATVIHSGF